MSFMHTACVWSEKTTVCRIFSCQRLLRSGFAFALPLSLAGAPVPRAARAALYLARHSQGPQHPAPFRSPVTCRVPQTHFCRGDFYLWLLEQSDNPITQLPDYPITQFQSGEYRARTGDLLVANQALSQLS